MKKLVQSHAGVKLERVKRLSARQNDETFWRLTSSRNTPERVIFDKDQAQRAFAREVAASLEDKVVRGLIEQGALDN